MELIKIIKTAFKEGYWTLANQQNADEFIEANKDEINLARFEIYKDAWLTGCKRGTIHNETKVDKEEILSDFENYYDIKDFDKTYYNEINKKQ